MLTPLRSDKPIYFSVKALIFSDAKFLAMHRRNEDWWELPGGRMEFGETATETVIREVLEETGLNIQPAVLFDTWNSVREDYQITGIIYLCKLEGGKINLSDEHDTYEWMNATSSSAGRLHSMYREPMLKRDWQQLIDF